MRSKFKWIFTLLVAFTMQFSFAQEKTIKGVVSDASGPLPGVNIVVKGTQRNTQTDFDGTFTIKASQGESLVFSFMGMNDITRVVDASNSMTVRMSDSAKELETVVVTALGIKKRQDAIVSTNQVVRTKELTQAAQPNVVQSLAGKVSGLQINTTANGANPTTRIVLRGNRSLTGNNQALIVIDGSISTATILQQLPPEVIESVNVVKGQQGAALYGEQGSNGVIIVTTKKGATKSKFEASITSSIDFMDVAFMPKRQTSYGQGWVDGSYDYSFPNPADPRNGSQYAPLENGAWGPSFSDPAWAGTIVPVGLPQADGSILQTVWKSRGSNNIKDFFQTGVLSQVGATLNFGGENGYALLSVNRMNNDFVVDRDGLKRSSFLFKGGQKSGKFTIDGSASYTNQSVSETDSNLLFDLLQTPTNVDVNMFRNSGTLHHWTVYAKNPFQTIKQQRFDENTNNFNGTLRLEYQFTKHISASYNANAQINSTVATSHNDGFTGDYLVDYSPYLVSSLNGTSYADFGGTTNYEASDFFITNTTERNIYGDFMVNFDYDLTKDLNLKVNVGQNVQDRYTRFTQQGGTQLNIPGWYNIKNVSKPELNSKLANGFIESRRLAAFANLDLDYKGYLFLNATDRNERSSTVTKAFNYYSAGVGFIPTKAFELKSNILNYAKVYANYTKVGNTTPVNAYATTDISVSAAGFPFGDLVGFEPRKAGVDPKVRPEFVTTKEAGVNLGFLKDRITLEGSVYSTDTKDLITASTTSTPTGLLSSLANTGNLRNTGFEADLGLVPFKSENGFNWNMRAGFTHYKTVVKSLSAGVNEISLATNNNAGVGIFAVVGEEYPLIKGTQLQTDAAGHVIVDARGIPLVTSTLQKVGKVNPDYIINFSNTFSYKGLSLTAVADYRSGHSVWSQTYNTLMFAGYTLDSAEFDRSVGYLVPNSVTNTGTLSSPVYTTNSTLVAPANLATYYGVLDGVGQKSIVDASTVKIREISLAYNLPSKFLRNTGISTFKISANTRNPFTFFIDGGHGMKNKGYTDPEASFTTGNGQGLSNVGQYPSTKTYGLSVNVTF